eukprot:Hpha_TRINITY_DN15327_c4_g1::TRINITY_DN15327_c4_g1_i1::g.91056::m.91056/K10396/KIF5; kinesin family member 5
MASRPSSAGGAGTAESVRVCCRARRFLFEDGTLQDGIIECEDRIVELVQRHSGYVDKQAYKFDTVFDAYSTQEDVFVSVGPPLLNNIFAGRNAAVICYGQTGSGKTYTMTGRSTTPEDVGIIPRITRELFNRAAMLPPGQKVHIEVSYMQIYKDEVFDLLEGYTRGKNPLACKVKEERTRHGDMRFVCKGMSVHSVHQVQDVERLLRQGEKARITAATHMNQESSRSHAILSVEVSIDVPPDEVSSGEQICGRMYLVDLAGSEIASRTGAEGARLAEAASINQSLTALRGVVQALSKGVKHVPYRDSALTKLLRDTLGGNSLTTMICTVSPEEESFRESRSTLEFGKVAGGVTNCVRVNVHRSVEELIQVLNKERARLLELNEQRRRLERQLPGNQIYEGLFDTAAVTEPTRRVVNWVPEHLCCPLVMRKGGKQAGTPMVQPVTALDGMTYERMALEEFFSKNGRLPNAPVVDVPCRKLVVVPNRSLALQIEFWKQEQRWPTDVLHNIASYLTGMCIAKCMDVCVHWRDACEVEPGWRQRCEVDFSVEVASSFSQERHHSWARFYFKLYADKQGFRSPRAIAPRRGCGLRLFSVR